MFLVRALGEDAEQADGLEVVAKNVVAAAGESERFHFESGVGWVLSQDGGPYVGNAEQRLKEGKAEGAVVFQQSQHATGVALMPFRILPHAAAVGG